MFSPNDLLAQPHPANKCHICGEQLFGFIGMCKDCSEAFDRWKASRRLGFIRRARQDGRK